MDRSDKAEIVTSLMDSHWREENEALSKLLRAKENEVQALRHRLNRMTDLNNMATRHVATLNTRLDDFENMSILQDQIIREYFVNNVARREAWAAYCAYDDYEYNVACNNHDMFGDTIDTLTLHVQDDTEPDEEMADDLDDDLMNEILEDLRATD